MTNFRMDRPASGLCYYCGSPLEDDDHRACAHCRKYNALYARKRRQYNVQVGLCGTCGTHPVMDGKTTCESCAAKHKSYQDERKQSWKDHGLCATCGGERDDLAKVNCARCREYNRSKSTKAYKKFVAENRCVACGTPLTQASSSKRLCPTCHDKAYQHTMASHSNHQFAGFRELVIERDKVCQICGANYEKGTSGFVVHHIDSDRTNNQPDNLVLLCRSCHLAVTRWLALPDKHAMMVFLEKHYPLVKEQNPT